MNLDTIERMDFLIRTKSTGSPDEFACKLGLSTRSLYNYLHFMKVRLRAPIEFCKNSQNYYYSGRGVLLMGWTEASVNTQAG